MQLKFHFSKTQTQMLKPLRIKIKKDLKNRDQKKEKKKKVESEAHLVELKTKKKLSRGPEAIVEEILAL